MATEAWMIRVVVAGLAVSGCMKQPQTRAEFVTVASAETKVISADFETVVGLVEERSKTCLAKFVDRSGSPGGQVEVASSEYHPTFQRISTERAELTLQVVHSPSGVGGGPMPPGGMYLLTADIVKEPSGQVRYSLSKPTMGHGDVIDAVREWLEGRSVECPDF